MIVDKINQYLSSEGKDVGFGTWEEVAEQAAWCFSRQFGKKKERSGSLHISSLGKCPRQQAYKLLSFPVNGKELDSRSKMVFFQGDMAELAVVHLAQLAGCHIRDVSDSQRTVCFEGVLGHPDGIMTHENEDYLVEVKSMSSFGFAKFEKGDIDDAYVAQVNAYMHALGLNKCVMVALNKDSGVLNERIVFKDEGVIANLKAVILCLKRATIEDLPERPYQPDEKGFLPWQCLYCSNWGDCWPKAERVLAGKAYKLKIKV